MSLSQHLLKGSFYTHIMRNRSFLAPSTTFTRLYFLKNKIKIALFLSFFLILEFWKTGTELLWDRSWHSPVQLHSKKRFWSISRTFEKWNTWFGIDYSGVVRLLLLLTFFFNWIERNYHITDSYFSPFTITAGTETRRTPRKNAVLCETKQDWLCESWKNTNTYEDGGSMKLWEKLVCYVSRGGNKKFIQKNVERRFFDCRVPFSTSTK